MAEVKVTKAKESAGEVALQPSFVPKFRGNLFSLNPFALMRQFTEEMDALLGGASKEGKPEFWEPTVEVREADGKMMVTAELPGLNKEDIKVKVNEDGLVLEGERKQEKEEKREGYYRSERSYGRFFRSIPLPKGADPDKASAEFSDGLLKVVVPVAQAKSKEVPVQSGAKPKAA
jgi:HSP20 family protein